MTLVAVVSIHDEMRHEITEVIEQCKEGGLTLRLATSDHLQTAREIALRSGLVSLDKIDKPDVVLDGKTLMERVGGLRTLKNDFGEIIGEEIVDKREFDRICKRLRVLGRCTPDVRYLLVAGLKEHNLVAATGHGNYDVLSLRKADVGLAFGRREGCEISKDNSDIVLLDESFKSI